MRIGLSPHGTIMSMGFSAAAGRPLITPVQLMQRALELGLEGVEISFPLLQGQNLDEVRDFAREHRLFITLATGGYWPDVLAPAIQAAAQLEASVVRTLAGGARLGGDRRAMAGGKWQPFLQEVLTGLCEAVKRAEQEGVALAVENHQDLASEELLWLCEEIGSSAFGITLDTGNPLATAEDPLDFARRVMPYCKNIHLKDYRIYKSDEGYRLARCPLGQGVIDFPALLTIVQQVHPDRPMVVELGALEARHIRVFMDDYWPDYPPRTAAQLAQVLRFVNQHASESCDWRTPLEREESIDAIIEYEERELAESLTYLSAIQAINVK